MRTTYKIQRKYMVTRPFSNKLYLTICTILGLILTSNSACTKFVEVDDLKDQLLSSEVFNNDASSNSAILGIYNGLKENQASGTINALSSLSSDDMTFQYAVPLYTDYQTNTINPTNSFLPWSVLYSVIYKANSAIEGLQSGNTTEAKKSMFLGEAKFLRAYAYFYLVNFFGDVPLITTTNVDVNRLAPRRPASEVYALIESDLLAAQEVLTVEYSFSIGAKTRVNKWAATAMLARVYLYLQKWQEAENLSSKVINSGVYGLLNSPNGIFIKNNKEAIFQLDRIANESFSLSDYLIPASNTSTPYMVCTPALLSSFEGGDLRRNAWTYPLVYNSLNYTAAYKFTEKGGATVNELESPLRLAEQYLIRAEARAMLNNFAGATDDVNMLRLKHGGLNAALPTAVNKDAAINIIVRERRVELFAEGAHRWFDLKRLNKVDAVMQGEKPSTWKNTAVFYPIPLNDILKNSNLKQNPGYQ